MLRFFKMMFGVVAAFLAVITALTMYQLNNTVDKLSDAVDMSADRIERAMQGEPRGPRRLPRPVRLRAGSMPRPSTR